MRRGDNSAKEEIIDPAKEPYRFWIAKQFNPTNLFARDKAPLLNLAILQQPARNDVRHWFAGTAPLLPVTEPTITSPGLSTVLARVLMAHVITRGKESTGYLEQAEALLVRCLHATGTPFDVAELATVISEDDDELIVILDALLQKEREIRLESPLHLTRLLLQVFTASDFNHSALMEMLFDDETGKKGVFPLMMRLFEWFMEDYGADDGTLRAAARTWRKRLLVPGAWRDPSLQDKDDEDEEEEEDDAKGDQQSGSASLSSQCGKEGEAMEVEGAAPPHPKPEPEQPPFIINIVTGAGGGEERTLWLSSVKEGAEPEPEDEQDEEKAPFLVKVDEMAGQLVATKAFLLPADEEPRDFIRPFRIDDPPTDVWPRVHQMAKKLSEALQRQSKNRRSKVLQECRLLIDVVEKFLRVTKEN